MEIGGGLVIASYPLKMLTLACAAAVLPACLITERKDYQEAPSLPPSIVATPASLQLDRIIVLDDVLGPDGGVGELRFDVIVREPNVRDIMKARVFVNRVSGDTNPRIQTLETLWPDLNSDKPTERPYGFTIDTNALPFRSGDCNKIELIVANDFKDDAEGNFTPLDLNESARAVWWAGPRGADMARCNP